MVHSLHRGQRRCSSRFLILRWTFVICSVAFSMLVQPGEAQDDDNDFAEFDDEEFENVPPVKPAVKQEAPKAGDRDFDDDEDGNAEQPPPKLRKALPDDDDEEEEAQVEEEDDEFAHFEDEEEFVGYKSGEGADTGSKSKVPPPKTINITKVPSHLSNNWENYVLEILMAVGIVVYFLNFFSGKSKNQRIANAWFNSNKALLESNFALVGDDGAKDVEEIQDHLVKESEHGFSLWCSGRTGCEGMLVDLKLLKRQDLVSVIANIMKPSQDQVQIKVHMNSDDMDSFVFCLATKKSAARLAKDMTDINTFCPEKRSVEKFGVPANFVVMSEVAEVSAAMLDSKMTAILNKYPDNVESIHFSDQFTGPKPGDDQVVTELPEGKKVLIFTFNMNLKKGQIEDAIENLKPLMLLVFYFVDKIKRYRLSKEAKNKTEKNRNKVHEAFWRSIHSARAEKAQEERERKRRELKERIKEIEDPERQRKMEERELRREKKKAQPKMKQMKIKAM